MKSLPIVQLPGTWAVAEWPVGVAMPTWTDGHAFVSVTHTPDEASIICPAEAVPLEIKAERGWALFKVEGPLDFSEVGVLASLAAPLAEAGVPILALGTFGTDYFLVKNEHLAAALAALQAAGHHCP